MEFLADIELHCVGGGDLRAEELAAAPLLRGTESGTWASSPTGR